MDYIISPSADNDFREILAYTLQNFGDDQMINYKNQLQKCLSRLSKNPEYFPSLEVRRSIIHYMHCKKHYIFAQESENRPLLVIAVLHKKMDLVNRLKRRL